VLPYTAGLHPVTDKSGKGVCTQPRGTAALGPSFVAVEAAPRGPVRPSRMSRKRAIVLILVHVAILIHLVHWKLSGRTISPLEPSEAMYTLRDGVVNAGAILLVLSILSTLVLGRFFCGWGCHVVALQDLCAWMLKKVGITPRPLRSRWLMIVPLLAGLYMFFWPSLMGLLNGIAPPEWKKGLLKTEFWETFPGFWVGALTFLTCGFAIVYLLGAKGFCTYACPYGGLFGVVDRLATGRIRVTDACKQCGHCTAVCTSNVSVSREVLEYGMVVDPGCMKCQDCISVCPEDALYFGFGKPALFAKPRRKVKARPAPQFSWREELALLAIFGVTLGVLCGIPQVQRGRVVHFTWADDLYGKMPLLFGLGLSAITAFCFVFAWRVLRRPDVAFLGKPMKAAKRVTGAGKVFLTLAGAWLIFLIDSAAVQYNAWQGFRLAERDETARVAAWRQQPELLSALPAADRARWRDADAHLAAADRLGLVADARIPRERSWFALVDGRVPDAVTHLRESMRRGAARGVEYRELAHLQMLQGLWEPAIGSLREAVRLTPGDAEAHAMLVHAYLSVSDLPRATAAQRTVVQLTAAPEASRRLATLILEAGDLEGGIAELRALVAAHPQYAPAHATLGLALQSVGKAGEAKKHLDEAERLAPGILGALPPVDSRPAAPR
jgi:ferredoxin/tetratricopeptide (TPR) repeat protein